MKLVPFRVVELVSRDIRGHHRFDVRGAPPCGEEDQTLDTGKMESPMLGVTEREHDVLRLVAKHLTNSEIADRLFLSVRTVESHMSSLIRKLGVKDRRGLARRAEELGLLHPER